MWFESLDEYVVWELHASKTDTRFPKERIEEMYAQVFPDQRINKSLTKFQLLEIILGVITPSEIYQRYKNDFGIKLGEWMKKFNLTQAQRRAMEKSGYLLTPVYINYEKCFQKFYADVSYYLAENYFNYTLDEVEQWKREHIRGYAKNK